MLGSPAALRKPQHAARSVGLLVANLAFNRWQNMGLLVMTAVEGPRMRYVSLVFYLNLSGSLTNIASHDTWTDTHPIERRLHLLREIKRKADRRARTAGVPRRLSRSERCKL